MTSGNDLLERTTVKPLLEILDRLKSVRVLVVGDMMLDRYVSGDANRISPEAPVPVVLVEHESHRAGGAANVAMNLAAISTQASLIGRCGTDSAGDSLLETLRSNNVHVEKYCQRDRLRTILKTRVVARTQQICRIDHEDDPKNYEFELNGSELEFFERAVVDADAVILSDYTKGVVTQELYDHLYQLCERHNKLLAVDPKPRRKINFLGAGLMTPNAKEALELAELPHRPHDPFPEQEVCRRICEKYQPKRLVVTLGSEGMLVVEGTQVIARLPTVAREVFDVSGAGDTVIAMIVAALAGGASLNDAAHLGNVAAGIVVGKFGTAVATSAEIVSALRQQANLTSA